MVRYFLSSRLVQGALVGLVLFCVGIHLYIQWDLARFEADLPSPPQDTEGHWHGDAHPPGSPNSEDAAPHAAPEQVADDGSAIETSAPLAPPTLTRDELPEALPYPMTQANPYIWDALVTEAAEDPELMQKLLPDTKEKAHETSGHLGNSWAPLEFVSVFEDAMWRKLAGLYPNDAEVLILATIYMPYGPRATRAEKEAYVDIWERIKRLNDEQGIPLTSGRRKTPNLSQTYIDLGEIDKAIQNMQEQQEWIDAIRRAGLSHMTMHHGLLGKSGGALALELKRQQPTKQRPWVKLSNPNDKER